MDENLKIPNSSQFPLPLPMLGKPLAHVTTKVEVSFQSIYERAGLIILRKGDVVSS